MIMGICLLALVKSSRNSTLLVPVTFLSGAVLYWFRLPYMLIAVITGAYALFATERNRRSLPWLIALVAIMVAPIILDPVWRTQYVETPLSEYITGADAPRLAKNAFGQIGYQIWWWPVRVIYGLLSPFPWTLETLTFRDMLGPNIGTDAQAVVGLALFILTIKSISQDLAQRHFPPIAVPFALLFFTAGISGYAIHSSYTQVGMVFLFPYVLRRYKKHFGILIIVCACFIFLASIAWYQIR